MPVLTFSTSAPVHLPLPPKKSTGVKVVPKKGTKSLVIKKKKKTAENRARRPAPGERKALRKRIVLSNVNALKVPDMQDINAENMYDRRLKGQMLGLPEQIVDQLRAAEAFKPTQGWKMFWRPGMLMRRETVDMGKMISDMSDTDPKARKSVRRILVGEKGSGKSIMLLQAMTMAMLKGWTVINLPEAQDITIGHTPYQPLPGSNPTTYIQPAYLSSLLNRISLSNPHLASLTLSQPPPSSSSPTTTSDLPPLPPNISLARLASLGASDPSTAHPIFTLLLSSLLAPGAPPIFIALDGLAHAMQPGTGYTSPHDLRPIHPHDLDVIQTFTSFLSGRRELVNGGIVLAATNASHAPKVPALDVALSQLEGARMTSQGQSAGMVMERNPFVRYDERVFDQLVPEGGKGGKIEVKRLEGLSKEEARGLMEYWARSGMVREKVNEGFVGEKWTVSGGGVVGELERSVVRMRV
ncbi:MAG: hypothetical protein Q9220_002456 [cf. Caloplaca sp. 1 TL-2023]